MQGLQTAELRLEGEFFKYRGREPRRGTTEGKHPEVGNQFGVAGTAGGQQGRAGRAKQAPQRVRAGGRGQRERGTERAVGALPRAAPRSTLQQATAAPPAAPLTDARAGLDRTTAPVPGCASEPPAEPVRNANSWASPQTHQAEGPRARPQASVSYHDL